MPGLIDRRLVTGGDLKINLVITFRFSFQTPTENSVGGHTCRDTILPAEKFQFRMESLNLGNSQNEALALFRDHKLL